MRDESGCDPHPRRKLLKRFETAGEARFLTFSCDQRLPYLDKPELRDMFVEQLLWQWKRGDFRLYGWVVMPEHVHLLLLPHLSDHSVSRILGNLKSRTARKLISVSDFAFRQDKSGAAIFWLPGGGYDRNIHSRSEFAEKLAYIENNPVERGLVERACDWKWSSSGWPEKAYDDV